MSPKITAWKLHLEWLVGAALASVFLGLFIKITTLLRHGSPLREIDELIFAWIAGFRTPSKTSIALDVTALGSPPVLALVCIATLGTLLYMRGHRAAVMQMALASAGAGLLVSLGKQIIARSRPDGINALIFIEGYSYPSGHSVGSAAIYLTIALLACQKLRSWKNRWAVMTVAISLIGLIGLTRVYLGVHYPSDVFSGLLLGSGWALAIEAAFDYLKRKHVLPEL